MGEASVAADRMPLSVGDEVTDGSGRTMVVVALPPYPRGVVICKDGGSAHGYCARPPRELVHAPSWWREAE